jgi:cation diffusion facilitator CzcD-associated flavoprotein CzcO
VIGAGFGGIAAAVKLRQRTSAAVTIFESADGIGGTWWANRYPGCEVDVHSHAYSFSFLTYDWPRTHATQADLQRYAEHVVDAFDLRSSIRLSTSIASVTWSDQEAAYHLTTTAGETFVFDVVVTAVGLLSDPRYPEWPGLEDFEGVTFHTARWEPEHDLSDKRVAVVGTGSTAAQVVPALADRVRELVVYQREPGWVEPKQERALTDRERRLYQHRWAQRWSRFQQFRAASRKFKGYDVESPQQRTLRADCERYIEETVHDPEVRKALTPSYPWGCKRPILASTYYAAFNNPRVRLVPRAVVRATPTGLVDSDGVETDVDVVVFATGFKPTRFLAGLEVTGSGGLDLAEKWQTRATAFLGITVPAFPNLFVLYGPNTNGGLSIIAQLERQAEVMAKAVRRLERRRWVAVDTRPDAEERYVRWIDRQIARHATAMEAGCHNYYHSESGANVTQWPRTHIVYLVCTRLLWRWGLTGWRRTAR